MTKRVFALLGAVGLAAMTIAYAAGHVRNGTFALQGGVMRTNGYLEAMPVQGHPLVWNLDFWLTRKNSGTSIAAYDLDMTKPMHAIVVSDDFTTFIHEHPAYSPSGHFTIKQTVPAAGTYHLYSDGQPTGLGQQVFRFDLASGNASSNKPRDLSERSPVAHVDGYSVALSGLSLRANSQTSLTVHVTRGGKPATDLHPYLHALAHAIFLDAGDLSYVHVHPVMLLQGTGGMTVTGATVYPSDTAVVQPNMLLHVTVQEPGTYKLWFQFRGGSSLHVASFVLSAT